MLKPSNSGSGIDRVLINQIESVSGLNFRMQIQFEFENDLAIDLLYKSLIPVFQT